MQKNDFFCVSRNMCLGTMFVLAYYVHISLHLVSGQQYPLMIPQNYSAFPVNYDITVATSSLSQLFTAWSLQWDYIPKHRQFSSQFNEWCLKESIVTDGALSPELCYRALDETVYVNVLLNQPCLTMFNYNNSLGQLTRMLKVRNYHAVAKVLVLEERKLRMVNEMYNCPQALLFLRLIEEQMNADMAEAMDTHWLSRMASKWLLYVAVDASIWGNTVMPIVRVTVRSCMQLIMSVISDMVYTLLGGNPILWLFVVGVFVASLWMNYCIITRFVSKPPNVKHIENAPSAKSI